MHSRIPGLLLTQYCAENSQQLAHRSDDGDLARLASLTQALIEGAPDQTAPRGRQGRHVQHAAPIPPAAGAMPGFALCAALIGIRRNAHKGRRFRAIDGPQFGQAEQQFRAVIAPMPGTLSRSSRFRRTSSVRSASLSRSCSSARIS
jgi:hypothetical protein